jgi:hypothetical protein
MDAWGGSRPVRNAAGSGSERSDSCRHVPRMCLPVRGVGASIMWVRGRLAELVVRPRSHRGGPVDYGGADAWVGPGRCGTQRGAGPSARTAAVKCRACVCQCGEWGQASCACAEGLRSLSCVRAPIVVDQCIMVARGCVGGSRSVRNAVGSGSERADSCRHVPRMCLPVRGVGASIMCVRGRLAELVVRAGSHCG